VYVIYDLLCVKSHQAELSILGVARRNYDTHITIRCVCVVVQFLVHFLFLFVFCVLMYDFIINK